MTIRTKLTLWYGGVLAMVIVIFSLVVLGAMQVAMLETIDRSLERTATEVIRNIRVVPVGEFGALRTQVVFRKEDVFRVPNMSIQVWQTSDGSTPIDPVLSRASGDISGYSQALDPATLSGRETLFSSVLVNDISGRVTSRPFYSAGGQQVGVVQVATSAEMLRQSGEALLAVILVTSTISIIVAGGLGTWLASRALKPIDNITQAAASIARADDLSTRLPWQGPMDELGRLTHVYNHMMERLEGLFRVQQRFVADVSHELRTPLTAIQGNLEIIERYGMDAEALAAIRGETERMTRMVSDLLLLARADYGEMQVDLWPLDLDTVLLDAYKQAGLLLRERRLEIGIGRFEPVRVSGNADRIRQLVMNLLHNAIKFTPDGGRITLSLYTEDNMGCLSVADTGAGISEEHRPHIFDRFFQADNSRAHHDENDGAGLGLSIVKWIVDVHGGSIDVHSSVGEGTTFIVRLPLIEAAPTQEQQAGERINKTTLRLPRIRLNRPEAERLKN